MGETSQGLGWLVKPETCKVWYGVEQLVRSPSSMSARLWSWKVCRTAVVTVITRVKVYASSEVLQHG